MCWLVIKVTVTSLPGGEWGGHNKGNKKGAGLGCGVNHCGALWLYRGGACALEAA